MRSPMLCLRIRPTATFTRRNSTQAKSGARFVLKAEAKTAIKIESSASGLDLQGRAVARHKADWEPLRERHRLGFMASIRTLNSPGARRNSLIYNSSGVALEPNSSASHHLAFCHVLVVVCPSPVTHFFGNQKAPARFRVSECGPQGRCAGTGWRVHLCGGRRQAT